MPEAGFAREALLRRRTQKFRQLLLKLRKGVVPLDKFPPCFPHFSAKRFVLKNLNQSLSECLGIVRINQESCRAVSNDLRRAPIVARNHRLAQSHRLHKNNSKSLLTAGHDENVGPGVAAF